jgi:uncharacterized protein YceH (UPF0502 family)
LQRLMQREPPLVKVLPRQPGTKEARYAHLLSGAVSASAEAEAAASAAVITSRGDGDRVTRLENEVAGMLQELAEMKQQLAAFRKQFE